MNEEEYAFAKKQAVKRLTLQSHSKNKLRKALLRKEISEEVVEQVIDDFSTAGYLNDEDYATRLIQGAKSKKRGPYWIKQKLQMHGINHVLAERLLNEHYPREEQIENARALLAKKNADPRKAYGLLVRNGYSGDIISDAIH